MSKIREQKSTDKKYHFPFFAQKSLQIALYIVFYIRNILPQFFGDKFSLILLSFSILVEIS